MGTANGQKIRPILIALVVIIALLLVLLPNKPKITGLVVSSLQPIPSSANVGDEVRLDVLLNNVTNLSGIQLTIRYNPGILAYDRVVEGNFLNSGGAITLFLDTINASQSGIVKDIAVVRIGQGASGSGTLVSVYFDAIGTGVSELKLEKIILADAQGNSISTDIVNTSVTVVSALPIISLFTANPSTINAGQSSTLSWITSGATSLSIDNGVGSVTISGTTTVSPATTTTYTLTATNSAGSVTAATTVTVSSGAPPPIISSGQPNGTLPYGTTTATLQATTNVPATCKYSTIPNVAYNSMANTFSTTGGTLHSSTISGLASGTSYNYYVKCKSIASAGSVAANTTVTVSASGLPTIPSFNANPSTINASQSSTLSWTTSGATSASINNGIGSVAASGTTTVSPATTTTYTLTAANSAGSVTRNVTVNVGIDTTPPVISSVSASSASSSATITWTTNENADSQVEYGLATSYGSSTTLNTALVTSHVQTIIGLSANTSYHYRVKSKDASGNLAVSNDFTFTTLAAGSEGPHDYFSSLIARPDFWKGYSLRPQAGAPITSVHYEKQLIGKHLGGYAQKGPPYYVTYDPANDNNPHGQDAAKVIIPPFKDNVYTTLAENIDAIQTVVPLSSIESHLFAGRAVMIDSEAMLVTDVDQIARTANVTRGYSGTTAVPHSSGAAVHINTNNLLNQVRVPLRTSDGNTYLFTWDGYWTDSYLENHIGHKAFQLSSGGDSDGAIWLETQTRRQSGSANYCPGLNNLIHVACITLRSYNGVGGGANWSATDGNKLGPGVTNPNPVIPKAGTFIVKPNTWVRFWIRIEQRANDYDYMDMWVADENTEPVQIYSHIPVSVRPNILGTILNSIIKFYLEFNTSEDSYVRGDLRDLVAYVRNFVALKNPPDTASLLQRPVK